ISPTVSLSITLNIAGAARMRLNARKLLQQILIAGLGAICTTGIARSDNASQPPAWPDTAATRLQALALLQSLNADLLSHDTPTLPLDRWCERHHLQSLAKIVAERDRNTDKPATDEQRK